MKKTGNIIMVCMVVSTIVLSSCGAKQAEALPETEEKADFETTVLEVGEDISDQQTATAPDGTVNEVVIAAHIKEIDGTTMMISSDTNEYPGAFLVDVPEHIDNISDFGGGDRIIIRMADCEGEEQGMKTFRALSIMTQEEEELLPKEDILLTAAPILSITDVLSSTMNKYELQSGNYQWNYEDKGQMEGLVACGMSPLDEVSSGAAQKLDIPDYKEMKEVIYLLNAAVLPDKLILKEWKTVDVEAEPARIIQYYCQPNMLYLEKDKVYEIQAMWEENNLEINGFYGEASYVFITE